MKEHNINSIKRLLAVLGFVSMLIGNPTRSSAQVNEQLWFEYMLNYPFANSYNLENAFTYSTLLNTPRWQAYDYSLTLERGLTQNVDLIAQNVISYTNQTDSYNTLEIRPVLGVRFHFTPNKRIQTRFQVRIEQRNFEDLDSKTWSQQYRPRARVETIIPLNQDSYFKDNLWYAIADAELLFVETDLKERFANRFRLRLGLGYRVNYSIRFEFIYMNQQSKNGIDDTFSSSDNIFRFRLKHYLRKTKPTSKDSSN